MSRKYHPSQLHISSLTPHSRALVFLVPGNPGLWTYYTPFLTHLSATLRALPEATPSATRHAAVFGTSLANFGPEPSTAAPLSLQGQVEFVERQVQGAAADVRGIAPQPGPGGARTPVVLVGHSVGAYIAMEVLRRWRERLEAGAENDGVRIVGVVGLWPTLTHLKESRSGQRFGWLILRENTAQRAALLAVVVSWILPVFLMKIVVRLVTWHPQEPAGVTTAFLRQKHSVEQSLVLARHELSEIGPDAWSEELWQGVFRPPNKKWKTKVQLYFGEKDHWVADEVRDALIESRAGGGADGGAVKMEIDQQQIPHSFCIRDSETVAEKTAKWVGEMLNGV